MCGNTFSKNLTGSNYYPLNVKICISKLFLHYLSSNFSGKVCIFSSILLTKKDLTRRQQINDKILFFHINDLRIILKSLIICVTTIKLNVYDYVYKLFINESLQLLC